jgi:hypothetical protein
MTINAIDLIKNIPPSARRILEISEQPTGLADIFKSRAPNSEVVSVAPDDLPDHLQFDCIVIFSGGSDLAKLTGLLTSLPSRSQILAMPDAMGSDLTQALAEAECHVFEQTPILRAWHAREAPLSIALHCSITPELASDAEIRIHQPNGFLRSIPGMRPMSQIEGFSPSLTEGVDAKILLMHRSVPRRHRDVEFLKRALAEGYLIVLDLDDDPEFFSGLWDDDAFGFRCLHALQVSTPEIASRLGEMVSDVAIFPNHLAMLPEARERSGDVVRIFVGGYNRGEDWAEIRDAANLVLGYFADRVEVEVAHDRSIFDSLNAPRKRFTPKCPYPDYIKLLESCDIALLPLRDTTFNRCKSDLKWIECAAHGVATLAPMTVYATSLADGKSGVLYRSPDEFMVGLQRLIQERDLRDRLVQGARGQVSSTRMLADHYEKRHAWYLDLLGKADALRAEHRQRIPELHD